MQKSFNNNNMHNKNTLTFSSTFLRSLPSFFLIKESSPLKNRMTVFNYLQNNLPVRHRQGVLHLQVLKSRWVHCWQLVVE